MKIQFQQIKRVKVYEEIVNQIKDRILSGDLKPGDKLPAEREIAEQFDVSMVSIRQALSILESHGLLVRTATGGTYEVKGEDVEVSQLVNLLKTRTSEINEPLEVRRLIEPNMARMAAERATEDNIADMEDCLRRQEMRVKAGELIVYEDSEFHYSIAKATKNGIIVKLVEAIHDMLWETREKSIKAKGGSKRGLEGHYPILEAIKNGDSDGAYEAMKKHLDEVEDQLWIED